MRSASRIGVRSYEAPEIDAAFQARALLEGLAARRAAARATPTLVEALRASCERYEDLGPVTQATVAAIIEENATFHTMVVDAASSTVVAETISKLAELPLSHRVNVGLASGEEKRIAEHAHRQLTKAIEARDGDWAAVLAHAHVLEQRDQVVPYLMQRQAGETSATETR